MTDMLMEFESLDRDDVLEVMKGHFDVEKKKQRLKLSQDLQCKTSPPAPTETSDLEPSHSQQPPLLNKSNHILKKPFLIQ